MIYAILISTSYVSKIDYVISERAYAILNIGYAGVIDFKNGVTIIVNGVVDYKTSVIDIVNGEIDVVNGLVNIPNNSISFENCVYDLRTKNTERKQYFVDMYGIDIYYLEIVYKKKLITGLEENSM
jgi:hypothetical protein